jgi:hypothetical protein
MTKVSALNKNEASFILEAILTAMAEVVGRS